VEDDIVKQILFILPSLTDVGLPTLKEIVTKCNRDPNAVIQYFLDNENSLKLKQQPTANASKYV
jgi:hypothetical protein